LVHRRRRKTDGNEEEQEVETVEDTDVAEGSLAPGTLKRPESYFFVGWMAFRLFGPLAPPEERLKIFLSTFDSSQSGLGRRKARTEAAAAKESERNHDTKNQRGLSMTNQIAIASIKSRDLNAAQDRVLINLHLQAELLNSAIDRAIRRGKEDLVDELESEYDQLRKMMHEERMKEVENVTDKFDQQENKRARLTAPAVTPGTAEALVSPDAAANGAVVDEAVADEAVADEDAPPVVEAPLVIAATTSEEAVSVDSDLTS